MSTRLSATHARVVFYHRSGELCAQRVPAATCLDEARDLNDADGVTVWAVETYTTAPCESWHTPDREEL